MFVLAATVAPSKRCWLLSESLLTSGGNSDLLTSRGLTTVVGELGDTDSAVRKNNYK